MKVNCIEIGSIYYITKIYTVYFNSLSIEVMLASIDIYTYLY